MKYEIISINTLDNINKLNSLLNEALILIEEQDKELKGIDMKVDKQVKDLKERNDKLKFQRELIEVRYETLLRRTEETNKNIKKLIKYINTNINEDKSLSEENIKEVTETLKKIIDSNTIK